MAEYENEFSQFPNKKIIKHNFKNVDNEVAILINQINSLRTQEQYSQAASIINQNKDLLSQYIIDATTYRTWEEEIFNTQKYARKNQQSIYFDESEDDFDGIEGDVWVGGV